MKEVNILIKKTLYNDYDLIDITNVYIAGEVMIEERVLSS